MLRIILITLSFIEVFLNFDTPRTLSNTSPIILILEHCGVLIIAFCLTNKIIPSGKVMQHEKYQNAFLASYDISLILLYLMWTPWLSPDSGSWGFDPQRYYAYAIEVIQTGEISIYLNGLGVVYFYALVMAILGIDPLVPLFVNSLLTYYAVLLVVRFLGHKNTNFYRFGWLLILIPELIYFNLMPSRDILCASFMTICVIKILEPGLHHRLIGFAAFSLLFIIRPTMSLPLVICFLINSSFSKRGKMASFFYLGIILALMVWLSSLEGVTSTDNDTKISDRVQNVTQTSNSDEHQEDDNSTVSFLTPHNSFQFVVFGIIRSFAYVVIPPGVIMSPVSSLSVLGKGQAPGLPNLSTLLFFLSLPLVFKFIRHKEYGSDDMMFIFIAVVTYFFVVGVFNPRIIHIRYRVVYEILYFSLIIWQWKCVPRRKRSPRLDVPWGI